jgi:glycosyltransferase involved in cell wall biosynthesis
MAKKTKSASTTPAVATIANPTVSIVTISQFKRFNCLQILNDLIAEQTYTNIIEWVIVEGSKDEADAKKNADAIKTLTTRVPVVYIARTDPPAKLGELRNRGNTACKGDITVVMDDDDYYPPQRVEHAVQKLSKSGAEIAGCSAMYIYDYFLESMYKFKEYGPNHSTNNSMAWKKAYLIKNKHDPEKESAEETSFTFGFKEPMVQLDADKTIVVSSHDGNTFNKRELLIGGTHQINANVIPIHEPISKFMKESYHSRYKHIFYKPSVSPYDIVYMTGGFSMEWDPKDEKLGGSEQAVVNLSTQWAKMGKKVAVYGQVPEGKYNGVEYIDWKKFPFNASHNIVILWRLFGLLTTAPFPIKAKQIWHDTHDNLEGGIFPDVWKKSKAIIQKVFFKSPYHRSEFEKNTGETLENKKCVIIPNGIRIEQFTENKDKVERNPYRFCYCSCYTRGLANILQFMWPIIYQIEPRAELHVYYGMNGVKDENFKKAMRELLSQPGVMDHGRQPMDIIIREKYMSSFHLYITQSKGEIDCISIRESLATGAIPLISNFGVFKDRAGIHYDVVDQSSYQNIALQVSQLFQKKDVLDKYRNELRASPLLISWTKIAEQWLDYEEVKKSVESDIELELNF